MDVTPKEFCGTKLPKLARSTGNVTIFRLFSSILQTWGRFRIDYAAVALSSDVDYPVIGPGKRSTVFIHDDVIKWKHFPRHWPFVQGNSPVTGEFPTQRPVTRNFDVPEETV